MRSLPFIVEHRRLHVFAEREDYQSERKHKYIAVIPMLDSFKTVFESRFY